MENIDNTTTKIGFVKHLQCLSCGEIYTLERLKKEGVQLIDQSPRPGVHETRVAFIHPKALKGVLIEIAEKNK